MSVLKSHAKLLVVAVPVVLLVAALTGLLSAGNERASDDQGSKAKSGRQANASRPGSPSNAYRVAQAALRPPNAGETRGAANPGPSASQSVLRIYRCTPGSEETVAARLHQEFGQDPSVRVVPDRRTSHVLVMGPPDVQARIAERLPEGQSAHVAGNSPLSAFPSSRPSPASPVTAHSGGTPPEEVQLWHTTAEQFEATLVRTLADRLTPVASSQPGASAYRLTLANGQTLRLAVDRGANRVTLAGSRASLGSFRQLVHILDSPGDSVERSTRLVSLNAARTSDVQRVVDAIKSGYSSPENESGDASRTGRESVLRLAMAQQQPPPTIGSTDARGADVPSPAAAAVAQPAAPDAAARALVPGGQLPEGLAEEGGLIGAVQVEILPGTDILVIRGHERDVQKVVELIEEIERIAEIEKPVIEVYHLSYVDCRSLATLLEQLYQEVFATRQGSVSITALARPNALLLIGRQESVDTVTDLIQRLDQPVPPDAQFKVFRLKNTPAADAQTALEEFFPEEDEEEAGALRTRVQITADFRTNSLIVRASPRDLAEVAAIIERIDAPEIESVNEVRIFKLKNSLAEDLAPVLQDAVTGQMYGQRTGQRVFQQAIGLGGEQFERKSVRLQFVTTDPEGQRTSLNSGILTDVQVTADTRANALIVTASADSMPLIAALIEQLDQLPTAEAQVKVFTIIHGDASNLLQTLQNLFGTQAQAAEPAVRTGATGEDSSLVMLRFAVDVRTNSIIATGSSGDLDVVEAILMRMDESDLRARQTVVIRLKNASAENVADAVNEFLSTELQAEQPVQGLLSSVEQTEREVVVVPEVITNSLIISATDRFFDRIVDLVEKLDARPPMVLIQVLIAAVTLDDTDEFGVELGLQDSILFDRSVAGVPGFLFNSTSPLGNNTATPGTNLVGTQGISNLSLGRLNSELGYGGLVLSASSESVSVLIRALKDNRRLDILSRPQIMTVDNVQATIHVGENVPTITSVSPATQLATQTFSVSYVDVGLQLQVVPRINPDGLVVMQITAIRSKLGPEDEGIPISIASDGTTIRSPRIEIVEAQTTISAMDGQTVILGGLITKETSQVHRRVPWLGDVPVLGHLFRVDSLVEEKSELLIILTPHVVQSEEDAEIVKQVETARIDWCLSDVLEVHGDPYAPSQTPVIYPDLDPSAPSVPELEEALAPPKAAPIQTDQSPFVTEPLPADPAQQTTSPGQGARTTPRPTSQAAAFDSENPSAASRLPPSYGQVGWGLPSSPDSVEQAAYELRIVPPRDAIPQ